MKRGPSVLIIFLTVFIDLIGFGIVVPLLPTYTKHLVPDLVSTPWIQGLVLAPQDSRQMVGPVENAADRGVPVVVIDSGLDPEALKRRPRCDRAACGLAARQAAYLLRRARRQCGNNSSCFKFPFPSNGNSRNGPATFKSARPFASSRVCKSPQT